VHRDPVGAGHDTEALRYEAGRPEEERHDRVARNGDGTCDDLVGCVVAAQSVDRDSRRHETRLYGVGARSGLTSRPRYVLHVGQTRCDCFGEPQFSHVETRGAEIACCARRLSRRDCEVFRFGTAMGG
jgi:hypothetical protein